jgi:hypothetical protein
VSEIIGTSIENLVCKFIWGDMASYITNLSEKRSVFSRFRRAAQQLEDVRAGGVEDGDDGSSKSRPVDDSVFLL